MERDMNPRPRCACFSCTLPSDVTVLVDRRGKKPHRMNLCAKCARLKREGRAAARPVRQAA